MVKLPVVGTAVAQAMLEVYGTAGHAAKVGEWVHGKRQGWGVSQRQAQTCLRCSMRTFG